MLTDLVLANLYIQSIIALVAAAGWWLTLRLMDCVAGGWNFYRREVLPVVKKNPTATAIIFGCRSLSVAIVYYAAFAAARIG